MQIFSQSKIAFNAWPESFFFFFFCISNDESVDVKTIPK